VTDITESHKYQQPLSAICLG